MANKQDTNQLSKSIERMLAFKDLPLVSRPEQWGTINFTNADHDLQRIFLIVNYLSLLPIEYLTDQAVNQINGEINQIIPHLEQINSYTIEQPNATQIRDSLTSNIHNDADRLYTVTAAWIPFLAYQKGDVTANINKLNNSVIEGGKIVADAKVKIEIKSKEIEDIITKAREASAGAGAAVFTEDFNNEATTLAEKANKWLIASVVLGLLTIIAAGLTWCWTQNGLDSGQVWQKIVSKFIILSMFLTATFWCGRIYKALMHQSAMNRHRALSLLTFQAFSAAASDVQTKDAVLLEATRSIFTQGVTGLVDSSSSSADSEARVIEIVKSVVAKK